MYESTPDAAWVHSIDLAQEADFDLGSLRVRPATCEVEWNGTSETLQRRVMQVLVALAQANGSVVSQGDLVMRCWRGLSVTDDAIVRCISKLRKLAAGYPDAPYAIETIPGVGYRLTPAALVTDAPAGEAGTPHLRRFRVLALVAAAALAVVFLTGALVWIGHSRVAVEHRPTRVTVQPFEALSNSGEVHSLARRIPNEVVDALGGSQIETILAGSATGREVPPGLIVTGIVRDDGRSTNVDVRIEDGTTHAALWSTEFKRASRETSDLPLEVAARVADMVNMVDFARNATPPLTDDSALSAVLLTTDLIRDSRGGDWAQLINHAQGVVTRNPDFAFGHSLLAAAYSDAAENIDVPDRAKTMSDAAGKEANLTLKLDPADAGAYAVLAGLEFDRQPYNYRAPEAILLRGLKLAKHPKEPLGALYQYEGMALANVGRLREALSFQLVAQATDQWSPSKWTRLALVYADMGNLPAARGALQKGVQRWPNHRGLRAARLYIAAFYEQPSDALATLEPVDQQPSPDLGLPIWRSFIEAREAHSGRVTNATIPKIREAADQNKIERETEIMMLAGLGAINESFEAANSALDQQRLKPWFLFTPVTRNLRQDPRFFSLASRMGLIDYWRGTGKRPDICTDPESRGECSSQLVAALNSPRI